MGVRNVCLAIARERARREAMCRKNPALAHLPETPRQRRFAGLIMTLIGGALLIADSLSWELVGSMLVVFIAIPIVFIPSGLYMMITGKNPFLKLKK